MIKKYHVKDFVKTGLLEASDVEDKLVIADIIKEDSTSIQVDFDDYPHSDDSCVSHYKILILDENMYRYTMTFSSKVRHFNELHTYAAMLEERGINCLVPIDLQSHLPNTRLYNEPLASRKHLTWLDIHKQKIDMSDGLFVYLDKDLKFEEYINSDVLKEIKYAMDMDKDVYFSDKLYLDKLEEHLGYYLQSTSMTMVGCPGIQLSYYTIKYSKDKFIESKSFNITDISTLY